MGKRLADEMGIAYYDREIIREIARKAKLDETYVEHTLNRRVGMNYPYSFSHSFSHVSLIDYETAALLAEQHDILRQIAGKGDCVIVGRGADTVLADLQPLKLFVYADMAAKIERCRKRAGEGEDLGSREMERKIKQIDKQRAAVYDIASEYSWGDKRAYHLCINTTGVEISEIVTHIAQYAQGWFSGKK